MFRMFQMFLKARDPSQPISKKSKSNVELFSSVFSGPNVKLFRATCSIQTAAGILNRGGEHTLLLVFGGGDGGNIENVTATCPHFFLKTTAGAPSV